MSSKKDMRRPDLVIPYQEPSGKGESSDISSTLSSTLPMAAMFMRNRYVGWAAVVYSVQSWLGESEESRKNQATPGYFSVGMAVMSLLVTYMPLFLPPQPGLQPGSSTEAPPPVPPA
ncbi:uncharacterized protein E0L32_008409 [Thyridium curvatum]|uniref:Protein Asterix n=1 Tax=Thyridium curvatum TaxID=1093900 RepID=A0A507AJX2_9PEZI|nr:uncharacterized protein E0L32_008409 [Thyridium curvatum]TPX10675.1 hypothetical protein E0L32_008409 [Thyridium curvatum]